MVPALWFGPKFSLDFYLGSILALGHTVSPTAKEQGMALANIHIDSEEDLDNVVSRLRKLADTETAIDCFGEFPASILWKAFKGNKEYAAKQQTNPLALSLYMPWKCRSENSGNYVQWVHVGEL